MKTYIIGIFIFTILLSCGNQNDTFLKAAREAPKWFVLENGRFKLIPGPNALKSGTLLPWTIQERVADIAFDHGTIIFGINGFGVAYLDVNKPSNRAFHYFFDAEMFSRKTITAIIPFGDQACCHFYFNTSLSDDDRSVAQPQKVNFAFFPVEGVQDRFVPYYLPLQKKREGFEAVGFLPQTKIKWYIEWKKAGKITTFDYSLYDMGGKIESAISRDEFRAAYAFADLDDAATDPAIRNLGHEIIGRIGRDEDTTTYHFSARVKDSNLTELYAAGSHAKITDDTFEIENVAMFRDERGIYALPGNDAMLFLQYDSNKIEEMSLPDLPDGYSYSGFFVHDGLVFLQWEETAFYKTGNAGLIVTDIRWN
jgi:hypothetical protein